MLVYALAILNGLPFSRCQLQGVTGNSLVTFTPAVKKMLPRVSTENRFCFSFVKEHKPFQDEKCNKFEMTLFFTLHVLLTAVPIGHAFCNILATHNTYRDKHQPFVSLPISRRFDKELRLNLANFKSNENPVFYWVHDVWCGGVLAEEFRWVRDGWYTGLGAGTGAGTVQVRYGYGTGTIHGYGRYGTWVRYMGTVHGYENRTHVPYPCTVPTVPMYRTRTVPVPYLYRTRTRTRTQTRIPTVPYLSFGIPSCFQNGQ